jgi:hypothetical protein
MDVSVMPVGCCGRVAAGRPRPLVGGRDCHALLNDSCVDRGASNDGALENGSLGAASSLTDRGAGIGLPAADGGSNSNATRGWIPSIRLSALEARFSR